MGKRKVRVGTGTEFYILKPEPVRDKNGAELKPGARVLLPCVVRRAYRFGGVAFVELDPAEPPEEPIAGMVLGPFILNGRQVLVEG
jgi:hypothetical protein